MTTYHDTVDTAVVVAAQIDHLRVNAGQTVAADAQVDVTDTDRGGLLRVGYADNAVRRTHVTAVVRHVVPYRVVTGTQAGYPCITVGKRQHNRTVTVQYFGKDRPAVGAGIRYVGRRYVEGRDTVEPIHREQHDVIIQYRAVVVAHRATYRRSAGVANPDDLSSRPYVTRTEVGSRPRPGDLSRVGTDRIDRVNVAHGEVTAVNVFDQDRIAQRAYEVRYSAHARGGVTVIIGVEGLITIEGQVSRREDDVRNPWLADRDQLAGAYDRTVTCPRGVGTADDNVVARAGGQVSIDESEIIEATTRDRSKTDDQLAGGVVEDGILVTTQQRQVVHDGSIGRTNHVDRGRLYDDRVAAGHVIGVGKDYRQITAVVQVVDHRHHAVATRLAVAGRPTATGVGTGVRHDHREHVAHAVGVTDGSRDQFNVKVTRYILYAVRRGREADGGRTVAVVTVDDRPGSSLSVGGQRNRNVRTVSTRDSRSGNHPVSTGVQPRDVDRYRERIVATVERRTVIVTRRLVYDRGGYVTWATGSRRRKRDRSGTSIGFTHVHEFQRYGATRNREVQYLNGVRRVGSYQRAAVGQNGHVTETGFNAGNAERHREEVVVRSSRTVVVTDVTEFLYRQDTVRTGSGWRYEERTHVVTGRIVRHQVTVHGLVGGDGTVGHRHAEGTCSGNAYAGAVVGDGVRSVSTRCEYVEGVHVITTLGRALVEALRADDLNLKVTGSRNVATWYRYRDHFGTGRIGNVGNRVAD